MIAHFPRVSINLIPIPALMLILSNQSTHLYFPLQASLHPHCVLFTLYDTLLELPRGRPKAMFHGTNKHLSNFLLHHHSYTLPCLPVSVSCLLCPTETKQHLGWPFLPVIPLQVSFSVPKLTLNFLTTVNCGLVSNLKVQGTNHQEG